MKIAILSPIAWRTPPKNYGPWEKVASVLTEGLVKTGMDVTLFATANSLTTAQLDAVCPTPYEEDKAIDPKVWECLHISNLMEKASEFDIIHNHFDFLPLSYSRLINTPMVTTIHGFSSEKILPVYKKYNPTTNYISISDADRHADLDYLTTVYHGISCTDFSFSEIKENYLLFYGRIHPDKGTHTAIEISKECGIPLVMAGPVQDQYYYRRDIAPHVDGKNVKYLGSVSQTEGNQLLGRAKALLHPIYFEEPFGLSVAEAMMCGTPVIAHPKGSMPELIKNGKTGFLVDSVESAIEAVGKLDKIINHDCRAHAMQHFSVQRMVENYIEEYARILA
ncbi:glycosyltransferase family 4 protein [Costertonia aggregata]|uniref:Glycosyltransferase family 4 protein n=1 Tax=Costertonia aggregata TaxID=343403 RepID=A0A7H9ASV2_9FLAO|nr:glycosyltransferase family 4 protein [Costertonia aggregata]QLG46534.1 glycosyltransferase family 4 protein [Costertonia aggregata]